MTGLLLEIPKIEVEIRPDGRSSFINGNDVLSGRSQKAMKLFPQPAVEN